MVNFYKDITPPMSWERRHVLERCPAPRSWRSVGLAVPETSLPCLAHRP
jgi:hypothetical protein